MLPRRRTRVLLLSVLLLGLVGPASWPSSFRSASAYGAYCVSDPSDVQDCIRQDGWYWDYEDCSCHKIASNNKTPARLSVGSKPIPEGLIGIIARRIS